MRGFGEFEYEVSGLEASVSQGTKTHLAYFLEVLEFSRV